MKNKFIQPRKMLYTALFFLLFSAVEITKGYAYTVTTDYPTNGFGSGTVSVSTTSANEGDLVTITANPKNNCGFFTVEKWIVTKQPSNDTISVIPGNNPNTATFIMPASNVKVTASFFRSFLFLAIFEDYQACEELVPKREHNTSTFYEDDVENLQLPHSENLWLSSTYNGGNVYRDAGFIFLAQNEKEGFQLFYREQEKERDLRIEVSPFVKSNSNDTLKHSVYWEEFFYAEPYGNFLGAPDSLAEALVPYYGETHKTTIGHNKVFFIELESRKNQTPGGYYISTITVYDGNTILATKAIYAKVWNFALPENHYSDVVMGLYNRNSDYGATSSFLRLNGINVNAQGNVAESDLPAAKQILDGYQECLLEHGVSTYEIPRWKMADDLKAAELTMANPCRKVFAVPVNPGADFNGSAFTSSAQEVIANYKNLVYDNPFLKDKAFFYLMDEPVVNEGTEALLNAISNNLTTLWPGYHAVAPFKGDYSQTISMLEGKTDILCSNQSLFDPWVEGDEFHPDPALYAPKQVIFEDFIDRSNHPDRFRTWRYQGNGKTGGTYFWISALATSGMMRRIVFWQQYRMNSDGGVHWNCAYLPNDWTKKTIPPSFGSGTGNGDGVLLYPGTMFGQDADKPVVSLRLKQLAAGVDDYDYLRLGNEFLTENDMISVIKWTYKNNHSLNCYMLNKQYDYYKPYTCIHLQKARYELGKRLSAANTEHDWDEWQTAVLPDENHDGLEIHTCSQCGAQESRPKPYSSLYRFVGTEDNQWTNLANWANNPETLPASGEAVVIAHDCVINTDITVFHVVVNDGCDLTINKDATLTSRRVSTEGNAQVIIEDGAQLYTMSEGVQATVKKNIAPHGDTDGWYFISTSLASDITPNTSNGIVTSTTNNYDLYWFNQSENLEWQNYKTHGFDLKNGKGYLYANSEEDVCLIFTGTTNGNDAKEFGLVFDANAELPGWNLVGNPYPCRVYVDKSYYVMDEDGEVIEPTPVSIGTSIMPCTGVMVKADAEDETVVFSKDAPSTATNQGNLILTVTQANMRDNAIHDKAIISFNKGDELSKYVFNNENAILFIPKDNKKYAIACAEKQGEMPLNFKTKENATYTLTVKPQSVNLIYLHLIDNITGVDVDLLATPNYTFNAKTNDYASRFRLVFSSCEAIDTDGDAPFAYICNGEIRLLVGTCLGSSLQIIDMMGHTVVYRDGMHTVSTNGMAPGIYILRLIDGDSVRTQKILVK